MKIMKRSVVLLISAIALTSVSCEKSNEKPVGQVMQKMGLELNYSGWDNTLSGFKEGDKAGLFAVAGANPLSAERYADNEEFIMSGGKFVGMLDARFADAESHMVAYAPYCYGLLPAGMQVGTVCVSEKQSSLYNYLSSDFKLGSVRTPKGADAPLKITLKRMFSKVNLELSSTVLDDEDLVNAVTGLEMNTACEVDFGAGKIVGSNTPARIEPRGTFRPDGEVCRGVTFITVPQQLGTDDEFIHLKIRGEESSYALETPVELQPGMEYTFSILVNKVGNKYRIDIDITEEPWSAGEDLNFEVDQEVDEIRPMIDIDGNEYEVVKIGAQYWTASNLRVSKYSNGSPITYLEGAEAWDKVAERQEGAWCYYKADQTLKEKYGCLYNWHAVKSGKLCPEGWHVPSQAEFKMLFDELGGEQFAGEAMKSTSGWRDYRNAEKAEYQGTNTSGFNGFPGGYRAANGSYLNEGKFGYWWCSSAQDEFNGNGVYLYFNNPSTVYISPFFRTGYSVRCVKY